MAVNSVSVSNLLTEKEIVVEDPEAIFIFWEPGDATQTMFKHLAPRV